MFYTTTGTKQLQSTFLLLLGTLIPSVLGVMLGFSINLPVFFDVHYKAVPLLYLLMPIILIYGTSRSLPNPIRLTSLLALTFITGLFLTGIIDNVLELKRGQEIIELALGGTLTLLAICATYAKFTRIDFNFLGAYLVSALVIIIVAGIVNIWLQLAILQLVISVVSILIFSGFLVYDVQQVLQEKTDVIDATLQIYLDLVNIFVNLLQIFASFMSDDD